MCHYTARTVSSIISSKLQEQCTLFKMEIMENIENYAREVEKSKYHC